MDDADMIRTSETPYYFQPGLPASARCRYLMFGCFSPCFFARRN